MKEKTNTMGNGGSDAGSQSAGSGKVTPGQADFSQGDNGKTTNAGGADFSNTKKG